MISGISSTEVQANPKDDAQTEQVKKNENVANSPEIVVNVVVNSKNVVNISEEGLALSTKSQNSTDNTGGGGNGGGGRPPA